MLSLLDYAVIVAYLAAVVVAGSLIGRGQEGADEYFVGGRDLPWWAACFSTVATETSTLTVIGLPAVAYAGSFTFLQLALGYLIGRTLVAALLLPRYFDAGIVSIYEYLGRRFGALLQSAAALTFQLTRLLADGVRLFATAIPLALILRSAGLDVGYGTTVAVLVAATFVYTWSGGIRAVIWIDCVQLGVYLLAGVVAILVLLPRVPASFVTDALAAGKLQLIEPGGGIADWLTSPYALVTAVVGGAVFSMASHGADQLMVQRLLACRSLRGAQYALVGSAVLVAMQFALFLLVGVLLWGFYGGADPAALGLTREDEIFPRFILEELPAGISGLVIAGIVAAAMSTLSSSMNSLASSTLKDIVERFGVGRRRREGLWLPRLLSFGWAAALALFAGSLDDSQSTVIELGLGIASFTYGALLGLFLLGVLVPTAGQRAGLVAFGASLVALVVAARFVGLGAEGFVLSPLSAEDGLVPIAWPWFPVIGVLAALASGVLLRSPFPRDSGRS